MFYKKKQKVIEWNTDHPNSINNNIHIDDYLVPSNSNKPKWFTSLKGKKDIKTGISNIKTCYSMLEMFKNSYTLISPCDFKVEISQMGWKTHQMPFPWISIDSHTNTVRGVDTQMGYDFNPNFVNLKFVIPIIVSPKFQKMKTICMSTFFENPVTDIIIPPGIMQLIPGQPLHLNLNSFVDLSGHKGTDYKFIEFRQGQPLCLFYFPDGLPKLEHNEKLKYKPRKRHFLDWSSKEKEYDNKIKKCPFSR